MEAHRGELETVPEHIHEHAPDAALFALERPALSRHTAAGSAALLAFDPPTGTAVDTHRTIVININDRLHPLGVGGHGSGAVSLGRRVHASDLGRKHPRTVPDPAALRRLLDELHQVDPAGSVSA